MVSTHLAFRGVADKVLKQQGTINLKLLQNVLLELYTVLKSNPLFNFSKDG